MGYHEDVNTKRMGDQIGRTFAMGIIDDGRKLSFYSMGDHTTSEKSMIHQYGDSGRILGMAEESNTRRAYFINGNEDEGREGTGGRGLPIHKIAEDTD